MFGKILDGLKIAGKVVFKNRNLITMVVPGGGIIERGINAVDVMIGKGLDPGTGAARRASAISFIRKQNPSLYSGYTDEEMHVMIQMMFMKKKFPQLF